MWNRLPFVSWIFALCLLLGCGTGIAHAAQVPNNTPTDPAPGLFSQFAGTWVAHGASLVITNDGHAQFEARTYIWCASQVPQPCDVIENNQIFAGYHEQLTLARADASSAYGAVVASNDPSARSNAPITLTLGANDTLIYANQAAITILCGPAAPAGTCGA